MAVHFGARWVEHGFLAALAGMALLVGWPGTSIARNGGAGSWGWSVVGVLIWAMALLPAHRRMRRYPPLLTREDRQGTVYDAGLAAAFGLVLLVLAGRGSSTGVAIATWMAPGLVLANLALWHRAIPKDDAATPWMARRVWLLVGIAVAVIGSLWIRALPLFMFVQFGYDFRYDFHRVLAGVAICVAGLSWIGIRTLGRWRQEAPRSPIGPAWAFVAAAMLVAGSSWRWVQESSVFPGGQDLGISPFAVEPALAFALVAGATAAWDRVKGIRHPLLSDQDRAWAFVDLAITAWAATMLSSAAYTHEILWSEGRPGGLTIPTMALLGFAFGRGLSVISARAAPWRGRRIARCFESVLRGAALLALGIWTVIPFELATAVIEASPTGIARMLAESVYSGLGGLVAIVMFVVAGAVMRGRWLRSDDDPEPWLPRLFPPLQVPPEMPDETMPDKP